MLTETNNAIGNQKGWNSCTHRRWPPTRRKKKKSTPSENQWKPSMRRTKKKRRKRHPTYQVPSLVKERSSLKTNCGNG